MPSQLRSHLSSLPSVLQGGMLDLRYGLRLLRRNWMVMGVAVLSLGVAIGANTAIFTLLNALLLQQLPVRDPQQLMQVLSLERGRRVDVFSVPAVRALEEASMDRVAAAGAGAGAGVGPSAAILFAASSAGPMPAGRPDAVERAQAVWVSGSYFPILGLRPVAGRLLTPADDTPHAPPVVVVSHTYWQQRLGGRSDAIGQPVLVQGVPVTVVGVTPRGFTGVTVGQHAELTLPVAALPRILPRAAGRMEPGTQWLRLFARVPSETTSEQAAGRLSSLWPAIADRAIGPRTPPARQQEIRGATFTLVPGGAGWSPFRAQYADPLYVLMGGVALVLLIACGNVAHLLLARASARRGEMSVRLAIGAGRMRLVRQLFTEGLILAAAGAALGLALSYGLSHSILNVLSVGRLDVVGLDVTPNGRVLGFSLILAGATALGLGAAAAWGLGATSPASLMAGQRPGTTGHRSRIADGLVAGQLALSLMLLVGAALFVQTLRNVDRIDTGFTADGVLLIRADPTSVVMGTPAMAQAFHTILDRIRGIHGVASAAVSMTTPLSGLRWTDGVRVAGAAELSADERQVTVNAVSPDYFKTFSTALIAGREFDARDTDGAQRVAVVSRTFVRRHLPGQQAIGRVLSFDPGPPELKDLLIVGIVDDTVWSDVKAAPPPALYVPFFQQLVVMGAATFAVRTDGAVGQIAADVRAIVRQTLPAIDVTMVPMREQVRQTFLRERLLALFASGFALLALGLSVVGLYALIAHRVARRSREIAVRMAIGAGRGTVMRMILRDAATPIAIGLGVGLLGAWWMSRYLTSVVFGLAPADPASGLAMTVTLFVVGLVAAWVPARRASTIDPNLTLRGD